jgi:lambda family phage portal protein
MWLDSVVGWLSPDAGARRLVARRRFEALRGAEARSYTGAAKGRHTDGWRTGATSADAEIAIGGRLLRDRARDLVRNNPHAARALTILATNIIGEGIMPRPKSGDAGRDAQAKALFEDWAAKCDGDGQLDFYGLQTLAVREMIEGGDVLSRRRWRRAADNLPAPMQIQLLEGDFLDSSLDGPRANGNQVWEGIEFDQIGQRVSYRLYRQHPGDASLASLAGGYASSVVPAADIAHLYEKQRTQRRGASWFAPIMRRARDIDDYDFAEGIRKKTEASMVGVVYGDDDTAPGVTGTQGQAKVVDSKGNIVEKFSPGLIAYLQGGKEIKFNTPSAVGGYEEYKRVTAREIAAGLRVPYALLTGDGSQENFSAQRYLLVEFRRFCSVVQWQIVIPMLLEPWWRWFCEAAQIAGKLDVPYVPVEWSPPKWEAIEPYKDAMADLLTQRMGNRSWREVTAARGYDPDDVLREIASHNAELDRLKVILDSDPRNTTMSGVLQKLVADVAASEAAGQPGQN